MCFSEAASICARGWAAFVLVRSTNSFPGSLVTASTVLLPSAKMSSSRLATSVNAFVFTFEAVVPSVNEGPSATTRICLPDAALPTVRLPTAASVFGMRATVRTAGDNGASRRSAGDAEGGEGAAQIIANRRCLQGGPRLVCPKTMCSGNRIRICLEDTPGARAFLILFPWRFVFV